MLTKVRNERSKQDMTRIYIYTLCKECLQPYLLSHLRFHFIVDVIVDSNIKQICVLPTMQIILAFRNDQRRKVCISNTTAQYSLFPCCSHRGNPCFLFCIIQAFSNNVIDSFGCNCTEKFSFHADQPRDASTDNHCVAFENHDIPQAGGIIQAQASGH